MERVTHKHVQAACERYNKALGFTAWNAIGRLQWADIRGDGIYRPRLYAVCNENGGVRNSDKQRKTMRMTIAAIDAAIKAHKLPHSYMVITQAIHERGETQAAMLSELNRRGLWLSDEQKEQAGLKGSN